MQPLERTTRKTTSCYGGLFKMLVNMSVQGMYSRSSPLQGLRVHQHSIVTSSYVPHVSVHRGSAQRISFFYGCSKSRSMHARTPIVCSITHDKGHAPPSRAVVIGGGMAGLASASSLSSIFDDVLLLERDTISTDLEVFVICSNCFRSCPRSAALTDVSSL